MENLAPGIKQRFKEQLTELATKYTLLESHSEQDINTMIDIVFVKRNWSQNAFENGSTLSQKFMTILGHMLSIPPHLFHGFLDYEPPLICC